MTALCHTCKVEHATDDLGVHCTGCKVIGTGFPVACDHYKPTREKQLEDALRELCEALDGTTTDGGIRVHVAIAKACELIPRKAS